MSLDGHREKNRLAGLLRERMESIDKETPLCVRTSRGSYTARTVLLSMAGAHATQLEVPAKSAPR